jgi:hypothetical protein
VVNDLTEEVARRLRPDGGKLVLAAHSQGSVLAAIVAARLSDDLRPRLGLLTYGSPLASLYTRLFPTHFGEDWLHQLGDRLDGPGGIRWRNLWRPSDPIGGRIHRIELDLPVNGVGHGGYEPLDEYATARTALWDLL